MFGLLRKWREKRLEKQPFPAAWRTTLNRLPLYTSLGPEEQSRLRRLLRVFVNDVQFEGCGGLKITDEIRVTIAAQACLLVLNRQPDYYPGLQSVLVYPGSFRAPLRDIDEIGVVHEGHEWRSGEAWQHGSVVLSWDDVRKDTFEVDDGFNVTFHEFAHHLDQQDGRFDGAPPLETRAHYRSWARILRREFAALQAAAERGEPDVIDEYGATNPAEFFAVVTETFFEMPSALQARHPQLYRELQKFFRQDPAARLK